MQLCLWYTYSCVCGINTAVKETPRELWWPVTTLNKLKASQSQIWDSATLYKSVMTQLQFQDGTWRSAGGSFNNLMRATLSFFAVRPNSMFGVSQSCTSSLTQPPHDEAWWWQHHAVAMFLCSRSWKACVAKYSEMLAQNLMCFARNLQMGRRFVVHQTIIQQATHKWLNNR